MPSLQTLLSALRKCERVNGYNDGCAYIFRLRKDEASAQMWEEDNDKRRRLAQKLEARIVGMFDWWQEQYSELQGQFSDEISKAFCDGVMEARKEKKQ